MMKITVIQYVKSNDTILIGTSKGAYNDVKKIIEQLSDFKWTYRIMINGDTLEEYLYKKNAPGALGYIFISLLGDKQIGFDKHGNLTAFGNKYILGTGFWYKLRMRLSDWFENLFPWAQAGSSPYALARFLNLRGF